jgi:hypothetical protein
MRGSRQVTLEVVPPELLEGIAPAVSYRCKDSEAILVPIGAVRGPVARKLNPEALESLMAGMK